MDPLAGYPADVGRELRRVLGAGPAQLLAAHGRGVPVPRGHRGEWSDGRQEIRPVVLDPLPNVVQAEEWQRLAAGVEQRHRALNAFLADAYRAAGRRRGDPDRSAEIVRAGVAARVGGRAQSRPRPRRRRAGLAGPARARRSPRPTWCAPRRGVDGGRPTTCRCRPGSGTRWPPATGSRAIGAGHFPPAGVLDCRRRRSAARRGARRRGPARRHGRSADRRPHARRRRRACSSTRLIADALDVPLVRRDRSVATAGRRARGGRRRAPRRPVDVLYRRFGDAGLGAYRTPAGQSLDVLLTEAVRAGRLGLANVPGNGIADDAATYAWVPAMIRLLPRRGAAAALGAHAGAGRPGAVGRRSATGCTSSCSRRSPATAAAGRCRARRARPRSSPAAGGGRRGAAPVRGPGTGRGLDRCPAASGDGLGAAAGVAARLQRGGARPCARCRPR